MRIEIWSIGKENEPFIAEGIAYYFRKIKPWIQVSIQLIPPPKTTSSMDKTHIQLQEEAIILKRLKPEHYLIVLDERGKLLSSPQWAQHFEQCMTQGVKTLVLLIGGAYGVTENIRLQARQTWSLSHLVFPHQLVRLIVAEQLYRSFSIIHHASYHHE